MSQLSEYFNEASIEGEQDGFPKLEVISAKISAIVHATEDADRVLRALSRVFPEGSLPSKADTRRLHGHYGNEIRMVDISIRGAPARSFLEHLWKNLPSFDRASVLHSLGKHLDSNGGLHLRLDKEEVFRGIISMKDQDPIKIHLSFRTRIKSSLEPREEISQLLESLENSVGDPIELREPAG